MEFDSIKARPLTEDEIYALTPEDLVYADWNEFNVPVLMPVHVLKVGKPSKDPRTGEITSPPMASIRSIYGTETGRTFDALYVADETAEEMRVFRTAGTRISSSLFFPGMDIPEVEERFFKALRSEFGAGVVQVWNMRSGPVADILRDVVQVRTAIVTNGTGKNKTVEYRDVERKVIASGVYEAQTGYFLGKGEPGWRVQTEGHVPVGEQTKTI